MQGYDSKKKELSGRTAGDIFVYFGNIKKASNERRFTLRQSFHAQFVQHAIYLIEIADALLDEVLHGKIELVRR